MSARKPPPKKRPWQEKQPDPVGDTLKDPNQPWWWRKVVGPAVKRFNDALPPGYHVTDVERIPGPNWCFAGETEFLTYDGYRTFKEAVGTTQKVMDGMGYWVDAPVSSFGVQPLLKVTLRKRRSRKVIYVTAEHKWFVQGDVVGGKTRRVEKVTSELVPGDWLAIQLPRRNPHVKPSRFGIAHGIVFGDGTRLSDSNRSSFINLWGEKDAQLIRWFDGCDIREAHSSPLNQDAVGVRVSGLPRFFKDLPSLDETADYLYGWLAGYFAADGRVGPNGGNIEISSASIEHLRFVQAVCNRIGIATLPMRTTSRFSCAGKGRIHDYRVAKYGYCSWDTSPSDLHTLSFVAQTIPDGFFLIEEHAQRFAERSERDSVRPLTSLNDSVGWWVENVEQTDRLEEVYCVTVPTTGSFVLQDNILVGNCRFRRDRHCYLPKDLDEKGTAEAGYQVWIPLDRGICTRETAEQQRTCPVGEPGPDSGERVYFPDATIPWSQGGQRKR